MHDPLGLFLAQILAVVGLARILGILARRIGQPSVIGEMLAGILLGPTFLGHFAPQWQGMLFPHQSMEGLFLASQMGVMLYLFALGIELDPRELRSPKALAVSLSGMAIPFLLGIGCAAWLVHGHLSVPDKSPVAFALFVGVALSITAFPVLSRILTERGLEDSPVGRISLSAAALGDVFAWSALALVSTLGRGSWQDAVPDLMGVLVFVLVTVLVIRPLLARLIAANGWNEHPTRGALSTLVLWAMAAGLCTQLLGIHALFGAFLAGVVTPGNGPLRHYLCERLESFAGAVLLPLFFAYTGLRVQFALGSDVPWLAAFALLAAAVGGKIAGSALPVRLLGGSWRDGVRVGILMNTRGLMELVALNVGLDLGLLTPGLFAVLVGMAIFTTFMTGPSLSLWERLVKER